MSNANILVCVSGSIAAYKSVELVSLLRKDGCNVKVVATDNALKFIAPAALEALSGHPVYTDMFSQSEKILHINLVEWAEVVVVYPASASALARLRMGFAEDLLTACFVANNFRKPYLVFPAMNTNMLAHPAVVENMEILQEWGAEIIAPQSGHLACGTEGKGRAPEPIDILGIIRAKL